MSLILKVGDLSDSIGSKYITVNLEFSKRSNLHKHSGYYLYVSSKERSDEAMTTNYGGFKKCIFQCEKASKKIERQLIKDLRTKIYQFLYNL